MYFIIINSTFIIFVLLFAYCYLLVIIFTVITIHVYYFIKMFNGRYITVENSPGMPSMRRMLRNKNVINQNTKIIL